MTAWLTGADRARVRREAVARYEEGAPIRVLAEDVRRSYGFMRALLLEAGVTLRSRGGAHGPTQRKRPGCGTHGGYQAHQRRAETACTPCRDANTDADRRLRNTGSTLPNNT